VKRFFGEKVYKKGIGEKKKEEKKKKRKGAAMRE